MILRRENVARHPAHIGAQFRKRLDEHCRLNRHVQTAHDVHAGKRLLRCVTPADGHQSGHFLLGQPDFFAAEFRQGEVSYFERLASSLASFVKSVRAFDDSGHE